MSNTKILIDCDPGHDDALAILHAAQHFDLVGLTTVHGNNAIENTTRNALAVLELGELDVPVAMGCAEPLCQPRAASAEVHGASGLDGADLPQPTRSPIDIHAVDFLIDMAGQNRGELVVAVIGPQTNIALALRREPRLKDWIRELTIMGDRLVAVTSLLQQNSTFIAIRRRLGLCSTAACRQKCSVSM